MQVYEAQPAKVPALSRTWAATVTYRECGVVTGHTTYTVTLDRRSGKLCAEVNGQPAEVLDAARILKNAENDGDLTLLSELRPLPYPVNTARCLGLVSA